MKEFIKRIKNDWKYESYFDDEPFYFKVFMVFLYMFHFIYKIIYAVLCFVTVPIWILPYYFYWKKRSDNNV